MIRKAKTRNEKTTKRIEQILLILDAAYPDAQCTLTHGNSLELLIATILSAQCTDERVNLVTLELFRKYRTAADYVRIPQHTLEKDIQSTGFYRNKAKSIQGACSMIMETFGGSVPDTMEELVQLQALPEKLQTLFWASLVKQTVLSSTPTYFGYPGDWILQVSIHRKRSNAI